MQRRHEPQGTMGVSRRLFVFFVILSLGTLAYVNMISQADMRLVAEKFPELTETMKGNFLRNYKIAISLLIFFTDIILVGPFAYLSYYGQHIKPRAGHILNYISFFDVGLILAIIFTFSVVSSHMLIIDWFSITPLRPMSFCAFSCLLGALFFMWCVLLWIKTRSYTAAQRKELKKYLIRF